MRFSAIGARGDVEPILRVDLG